MPATLCSCRQKRVLMQRKSTAPLTLEEPKVLSCFRTSGSTGSARLVCHSREGLMASAAAVNGVLGATSEDVWLCALPPYHVGGCGIYLRAHNSGSDTYDLKPGWDPHSFARQCEVHRATLSSLVPTQLYDLVKASIPAPTTLRAVLVGGGAFAETLERQARSLGWPTRRTYGLTEAGSQVATQGDGGEMVVLPHLQAAVGDNGRLRLRGASLARGYLVHEPRGDWAFEELVDGDGWFETDDLVELDGQYLRFLGARQFAGQDSRRIGGC